MKIDFTWPVAVKRALITDIAIIAQLTNILKIGITAGQFGQRDHLVAKNPDRADSPLRVPVVEQCGVHADMHTADPGVFFNGFEKISQWAQLCNFTD